MEHPTIVVSGASGKVGAAVVEQLRERGARVRALVHQKDGRSERLSSLGAEVVVADVFDPVQVEASLRGAQRLGFIAPWHPHLLDSATAFALAAPKVGLEAIVGLTQWLASPAHPALTTRQSWLADGLFAKIQGVAHVSVRPGFFADNYMAVLPMAANLGVFPFPMGGRKNAPPSNEDIARVMVGALLDPATHAGKAYRPTGPALLGGDDMARIMGSVYGRRVRHLDMPISMMMKAVRAQRALGPFMQSQFQRFLEDSRVGVWEHGGPTTHVHDVGGRPPQDFETIVRQYATHPRNQRRAGNLMRVLWDFLKTPFIPAPDAAAFERAQQHPQPESPELSGQSRRWAAEHGPKSAARAELVRASA